MNASDIHAMITQMVNLFILTSGHQPNEIHAYPLTMDAIEHELKNDNLFLWWRRDSGGNNLIMTSYCGLKIVRDRTIMPGVIYLDRDGQFTRGITASPYFSFSEVNI